MAEQQGNIPANSEELLEKYSRGLRLMVEGAQIETGQTPKETIWTKNKARLYHYYPEAEKKHRTPILIVYALINRPYILDLRPGNSFVEFLSQQGFDVYMLDWGIPGDEDADMALDDYVMDYIPRAARKVMKNSGTDEFTLFGYCMGGTMAAMYSSLFPEGLKNLILLTAPIDFTKANIGLYALFTNERYLGPERLADAFGNIPGRFIDDGNRMLKPVDNYIGSQVGMWQQIFEDKPMENWLAINKWVNDGIPFPGEAFKQWIRDFYQQNKLVEGEIELRGESVDLSEITVPLLAIAGEKDHICTPPQAEAAINQVSSRDKEFFLLSGGHVGILAGRDARRNLWPKVEEWLSARSE